MHPSQGACRLLHVITDLSSGGAQRMLTRLVTGPGPTADGEFVHTVVSLMDRGVYGEQLAAAGVTVHALGIRGFATMPGGLLRLCRLIRRVRPHLIQTWLYHADFAGLIAAGAARPRPPVIWNLRCSDMDFERYAWSTSALVRVLARLSHRPAAVMVNSHAGRAVHAAVGYRPKAWHVLPNGFQVDLLRPDPGVRDATRSKLGLSAEDLVFVCSARVDPMKDHTSLLAAFAQVRRARPGAKLMLLGAGTGTCTGPLARIAESPELAEAVIALGERTADYGDYLQAADGLVLASAFGEGFPNVLGEAMCLEIPCVTTDVGDSAQVVGDTGWIVPRRDPESLAQAMTALYDLPLADRRELGQAARARIVDRFGLTSVLSDYAAVYRRYGLGSTREAAD